MITFDYKKRDWVLQSLKNLITIDWYLYTKFFTLSVNSFFIYYWEDLKRSGQVSSQLRLTWNADKNCPVDSFYDAARQVLSSAPRRREANFATSRDWSRLVRFHACGSSFPKISDCVLRFSGALFMQPFCLVWRVAFLSTKPIKREEKLLSFLFCHRVSCENFTASFWQLFFWAFF